ncbi:solute carrier family 22 member 11 [Camelus ferus]|nr:solute carrier family 22 member 11 [Camelus ferus]
MAFTELLEQAGGVGLFQALQALTLLLLSVWVPFQFLVENFSAAVPGHRCWAHVLDNGSEAPANLTPEALLAVSIPLGPNREPHQCLRFRQPQWQLLDPNATATNWSEAATEPCVDGWVYNRSTFTSTIVTEWDLVCDHQSLKPLGQSIYMAGTMLGSIAWGLLSHRLGRKPILSWCCLQVAVANISTIAAPSFLVYCGLRFLNALGLAGIILTSMTLMVEWTTTCKRAITMTMLGCSYSIGQTALGGMAFALRDWRALQLAVSVPFFVIFLMSWPEAVGSAPSSHWHQLPDTHQPSSFTSPARPVGIQVEQPRAHVAVPLEELLPQHSLPPFSLEVLMSRMEEELASTKARQSVLDLFRVPALRWRSCSLLVVKYAFPIFPPERVKSSRWLVDSFSLSFSYYGLFLDLQNLGSDIFLLQVLFGAVDFLARTTTTFLLRFFGRRTTLAGFLAMAGLAILTNMLVPQDLQTLRVVFAVLGKGCFGISLTCLMVYKPELFPTSLR